MRVVKIFILGGVILGLSILLLEKSEAKVRVQPKSKVVKKVRMTKSVRIKKRSPASIDSQKVKRKDIYKVLFAGLPSRLCGEQRRMRTCFFINQLTCEKVVKRAINRCYKKRRVASRLEVKQAIRYSESMGSCVKDFSNRKLRKKRTSVYTAKRCE